MRERHKKSTLCWLAIGLVLVQRTVANTNSLPVLPLLLNLEPDSGPRDGGTRVQLDIFGEDLITKAVHVVLRQAGGPDWTIPATSAAKSARAAVDADDAEDVPFKVSIKCLVQWSQDYGFFFVTPNMSEVAPQAIATLVSLEVLEVPSPSVVSEAGLGATSDKGSIASPSTNATSTVHTAPSWEVHREYPKKYLGPQDASRLAEVQQVARPVLFRLSESLVTLAPIAVEPCCDLKISGGQPLTIWGSVPATAVARGEAVVRFRGATHQRFAQAELELNDGALPGNAGAEDANAAPDEPKKAFAYDKEDEEALGFTVEGEERKLPKLQANVWRLRVVTPPWPKAEGHIVLETSWNGQQFIPFRTPMRVVEEKSLFGDVSEGITEEVEPQWESEPEGNSDGWNDQSLAGASNSKFDSRNVVEEQLFTVVNDKAAGPTVSGKGIDMSKIVLVGHDGDSFVLSRGRDVSFLQEDLRLIHDLFLLLGAAAAGASVAVSINTPTIIGFLLGGVVVGPGGLNIITQLVQVESVAELGICMLLLCLGLDLIWEDLLSNTRAALAGIIAMAAMCLIIVFFADFVTETPRAEALCIGLFSALSSTPMSLRAIAPPAAPAAASPAAATETSILLSILVTQDVVFAGLLAIFPGMFESGADGTDGIDPNARRGRSGAAPYFQEEFAQGIGKDMDGDDYLEGDDKSLAPVENRSMGFEPALPTALVAAQVAAAAVLGLRWGVLARLASSAKTWALSALLRADDELFALTVLSGAFLLSYLTDELGLSVELGSFAAGLLLRSFSADAAERALHRLGGLRDAFTALFFASIGLVVNAKFLVENIAAVLSVVVFLFILKVITAVVPLWLLAGKTSPTPAVTAFRVSFILAHVSEFGFVLAARGSAWGVLPKHVYLLVIGANAVSLILAPWQFRALEWLAPRVDVGPMSGTASQALQHRARSTAAAAPRLDSASEAGPPPPRAKMSPAVSNKEPLDIVMRHEQA